MSRLLRQKQRRSSDPVRRQASADIYFVLKVPRLPRKSRSDRQRQNYEPKFQDVLPMEIHNHILTHPEIIPDLENLATLEAIVEIVHACPKRFTSYCTISNTVRAIGIRGSASLYFSVKISDFLAQSREADARNLVALTRSKGLCTLLLPSTHEYPDSGLHALRTLCAFRHGIFHVGKDPIKLVSLAQFLTQPDVALLHADRLTVAILKLPSPKTLPSDLLFWPLRLLSACTQTHV